MAHTSYDMEGNEMKKTLKVVTLLVWLLAGLVFLLPQSPITLVNKTAVAPPATGLYASRPTNYTFVATSAGTGVRTNSPPQNAYDGNNGTSSTWSYVTGLAIYGTSNGYVEFNVYSPVEEPPRGSHITQVDLHSYFRVTVVSSGDAVLSLGFAVGSSGETQLMAPRDVAAIYNIYNASVAKPGGGAWTWEDVSNLKYRFKRNDPTPADASGGTMLIYEVWATVHYELTQTVAISPKVQTPIPSQVKINVTGIEELYGIEFKITYNTTAITVNSVTWGTYLDTTAGGAANTYEQVIELNDAIGFVWATQSITGNRKGGNIASGTWQTLATLNIATQSGGPTNLDFDIKLAGHNYLVKEVYPAYFVLIQPGHDVGVTNVVAAPVSVTRGEDVDVDVTVINEGDYIETFNLNTYVNTSAGTTLIDTRLVTNLARNTPQIVSLTWDTRDFAAGNYTLSATAATRGVIDTDSTDNTDYGTLVEVNPLFGDITEDGWVNYLDLIAVNFAWGTHSGDLSWNLRADLNGDNIIDARDLRLLAEAWEPPV
jgi:hypothetical protein